MYDWLPRLAEIADARRVTLGPPCDEARLADAERRLGVALPPSYRGRPEPQANGRSVSASLSGTRAPNVSERHTVGSAARLRFCPRSVHASRQTRGQALAAEDLFDAIGHVRLEG